MNGSMHFTHLVFRGPKKDSAIIKFGLGLNLIYGPSNTGKSSILDAIDFMFGRTRGLKELPEHDGYQEILLGLSFSEDQTYTLVRSIQGGNFTLYRGTHFEPPEDQKGQVLRPADASVTMGSLRDFVLDQVSLAGKELKKNQRNEKERLTLRNLAPLLIINERDIQRESSPYISDQYTKATVDKSRLRLFLTGVDDSSLVPEEKERDVISRQARLQLLSEFIQEGEEQISLLGYGDNVRKELEDQLSRLKKTLDAEREILTSSEASYRVLLGSRNELRSSFFEATERLTEISEMLARFRLLDEQYSTDLLRLESIQEAGNLFFALPSKVCPHCGAKPEFHDPDADCGAGAEEVIAAASGEQLKIESLRAELKDVVRTLEEEMEAVRQDLPAMEIALQKANSELSSASPIISAQRTRFSDVLDKRSEVERNMELFDNLDRLQQKQQEIGQESKAEAADDDTSSPLPTMPLFDLSKCVAYLLKKWGLVDDAIVHFDKESRDFVINGKHRSSNGKGHRAITHAAASLGLLKFTEDKDIPFPGFIVLDSPLLAYEQPENEDDDLSGTDVNLRFLQSLAKWKTVQTIIFENKKSIPPEFEQGEGITKFTKSATQGRYGFFPIDKQP